MATISTINIGVEDFLEPNSPEEAPNGSSQQPPRRSGGSVHFNMLAASTKASPRHTVQINKTAPAQNASNGNGPVRDSNAVFSSITNRGKKCPGAILSGRCIVNEFSRQATPVQYVDRSKDRVRQEPVATCERSSEGKSDVILRHSSCELRENLGEEFETACAPLPPQRIFLSHSSPDPLQITVWDSMRDMSANLSNDLQIFLCGI